VIAAGVVLTGSTRIFDLVNETEIRGSSASPLEIPERAVVVPGSRPIESSDWAKDRGLHLAAALIVKYRDEKTDRATVLEDAVR
jgi:2,3,4,5-tetrahydropyridine-2-carboxylate N-succinyltransferase